MNKYKDWRYIAIVLMASLTLFSSCSYGNTGDGESKKEDKNTSFEVSKIQKYEGIRGEGWINDGDIIITKENQERSPIHIFDQMSLVRNMYSYDINSKEEKSLTEKSKYIWMPSMSPDGKYIFYEKSDENSNTWVITDIDGNEKAVVAEDSSKGFSLHTSGARWINNEEVIVPYSDDGILLININSKVSKIAGIGLMQTDHAAKVDNNIYYISTERNLVSYDINTKQSKVLKENLLDFELSPKKDIFAIEKRISESRNQLVLTDISGNEKDTLAEGKSIFGISWSPDQSKLAYVMTSDDESKAGLHLINLKSKEDIYVSHDFLNVDNGLKWSPSGKMILGSITEVKDMKSIDNTYIILLK
ncbi:MAG: hypothetical protein ACM3X7_03710 [Solirubrobacterales bacterium]